MGRQCGHFLSRDDEESLIIHVRKKFPIVVFDSSYPLTWDQKTTARTDEAKRWTVADERALEVLLEAATPLASRDGDQIGWQIRSTAFSCFEWSRRGLVDQGRFYLNTTSAPIWEKISALVGDDVERSFDRASRWLKAHCVNVRSQGAGFWVSRGLVQRYEEERIQLKERRAERTRDPRDTRFYELSRMSQRRRTRDDVAQLVRYCEAMVEFVRDLRDDTALLEWERELIRLRRELLRE